MFKKATFPISLAGLALFATTAVGAPPQLVRSEIMTGLENPWDLAFTPDRSLLFTEKCKGLSARLADGRIIRLFGTSGSALRAPDLFCEGQSGMNGVAIDPAFDKNRRIYVYMSSNLSTRPRTNRVVRLRLAEDGTSVRDRMDIVTDITYKDTRNNWGSAGSHSGGRLRFGPDGFLYVTTGDNHNGPLPQDLNRLGGKVLRIDTEGRPAPGNDTPAGGDPRIYTYGHRNVQGLTFHPETGQPFIAEHGPNHSDEITALVPGGNGGWDPQPEPGVTCADNYCGYISNKRDGRLTPMTDLEKFPGAMKPVLSLDDSQGMGPLTFLTGAKWKDWENHLVVGIMGGMRLSVVELDARGGSAGVVNAEVPTERYRSLVQDADGNLFVATDGGSIWMIQPR